MLFIVLWYTVPRLDAEQESSEERTETYLIYVEGAPQLLTQLCASSNNKCDRLCRAAGYCGAEA